MKSQEECSWRVKDNLGSGVLRYRILFSTRISWNLIALSCLLLKKESKETTNGRHFFRNHHWNAWSSFVFLSISERAGWKDPFRKKRYLFSGECKVLPAGMFFSIYHISIQENCVWLNYVSLPEFCRPFILRGRNDERAKNEHIHHLQRIRS